MVVKEVSNAIATMFGIELKDYNSGIASNDSYSDSLDSISTGADNASKKVKELKRQVLGFDEIHNINENKDSGSSDSSGSVSGGIDKRLLDAITGYDNGMDKVKMKATEIRDKIMEWLGFTKIIDPLTGKVSFKYEGIKKTLKNMWESFMGLSTQGKILVGILGAIAAYKLYNNITKIAKKILGVDDLVTLNGKSLTAFGKIVKSLKVSGWATTISKILTKLKSTLSIVGKVTIGVAGLTTAIIGANGTYNAMKKMTEEANYGGTEFGKYTVSILETVGGATALGAVLGGPLGGAIGALTGTIVAGISALFGYKEGIKELAENDLFGTVSISTAEWSEMLNNLNISINDNTGRFETLKSNLSTLSSTFDESANKLDFYGLKFGTLAQKITDEDSTNIKNAIQDMCDSANSIIDETTTYGLELVSATFKQGTSLTEEEQSNMLKSIMNYGDKQKSELKIAQDNITTTYDNAIKTRGYLTDEEYKYISEQLQKIRSLTNAEMSKSQTDIEYYKTLFADKNQKLDKQSYSNYKEALNNYHKEKLQAIEDTYNQEYNYAKQNLENGVWTQEQFNKYIADAYKNRNKSIKDLDTELDNFTDSVTESLKEKYKQLLKDNSDQAKEEKKIIEGILDKKTIEELKKNYGNAGNTSAKSFNREMNTVINGVSQRTLTIGIKADTTEFKKSMNNLKTGSYSTLTYSVMGKATGGIYSNGSWKNIPQYANGGAPSHGSMFVAGEHGAEIVGHINGRTEVLNQSQIASAIYSATLSAMSQVMSQYGNQSSEIDVHVHTDEGTVIDRIEQRTKQTGRFPLTIPTY